ncbi:MAG: hypothetical protein HYS18_13805 [Burkholderiales bacterium]|nr:hypothetical protein [Burkholderiales bacterium]
MNNFKSKRKLTFFNDIEIMSDSEFSEVIASAFSNIRRKIEQFSILGITNPCDLATLILGTTEQNGVNAQNALDLIYFFESERLIVHEAFLRNKTLHSSFEMRYRTGCIEYVYQTSSTQIVENYWLETRSGNRQ